MKAIQFRMAICLLLASIIFLINIPDIPLLAEPNVIIVTEEDNLQEIINNAQQGDIIYLKKGNYTQYRIMVNKSLTIVGEDPEKTIISGNNQEDATVILDVLADHVIIKNLTFTEAAPGYPPGGGRALILTDVKNVTIQDCIIYACSYGIEISNSSNNNIVRNNITQTSYAIRFAGGSQSNIVAYNNIYNNSIGISFAGSNDINNKIYNNNFIDNKNNIDGLWGYYNSWYFDYTVGGNYWSNYTGQDKFSGQNQDQPGSDGIGDEPYQYQDQDLDKYPYMRKIHCFEALKTDNFGYFVIVSTNSTQISNFTFKAEQKSISFTVSQSSPAYCRIIIPNKLLHAETNEWIITADSEKVNDYTPISNQEFTALFFTYPPETNQITIKGTTAIPELAPILTLILITISAIMLVMIIKNQNGSSLT